MKIHHFHSRFLLLTSQKLTFILVIVYFLFYQDDGIGNILWRIERRISRARSHQMELDIIMEDNQQEQDVNQDEVLDSVGVESEGDKDSKQESQGDEAKDGPIPEWMKKRLGMQEKRHQREMKQLRQEFDTRAMPMASDGMNEELPSDVDPHVYQTVKLALAAKEREEQKAKHLQHMAHVDKQYQNLHNQLNSKGHEKYDDFEDIVMSSDAPFSAHMRDAALLIPNAEDVFYKLGKNRDELQKISQLHPLDQAREIVRISMGLMGGDKKDSSHDRNPNPLNPLKNNPASVKNSSNMSISDIRRKLKGK
jgi:hypothetical protein